MTKRRRECERWNRERFALLLKRHGPKAIAKKVGAPVRTVEHWAAGTHVPSAAARARIDSAFPISGPRMPQGKRSATGPVVEASASSARNGGPAAAQDAALPA